MNFITTSPDSGIHSFLSSDHFQGIFDRLRYKDLATCSRTCRKWRAFVNQYLINRTVGDAQRARVLAAKLGPTAPVPENLRLFLAKDSPFWAGKKNYQARPLMAFIPPCTLNQFLTWAATQGLPQKNIDPLLLKTHGSTLMRARWVVMTPIIPDSLAIAYEPGKRLVAKAKGYQPAKVAEATVCIAIQILLERESPYGLDSGIFACCEETFQGFQVVVGGATFQEGVEITSQYECPSDYCGMPALTEEICP